MHLKHIQQWCPCSHFIASFALSSLQKSCHHFIWTQLFLPLAPRVMTFLFQPEQRSHSTFSIVGWKLISSRGMSCHPLSFPSAVSSASGSTYLEVKKSLLSFDFLNLAWPSTQLLSHALKGTEGRMTLMLIHFVLPLPFVFSFLFECLFNISHLGNNARSSNSLSVSFNTFITGYWHKNGKYSINIENSATPYNQARLGLFLMKKKSFVMENLWCCDFYSQASFCHSIHG